MYSRLVAIIGNIDEEDLGIMGDHLHSTESLYPMEASYNLEPLDLTQSFFAEIYTSYI